MGKKYIHDEIAHNLNAPKVIVPLILQYVQPQCVVDFGCGTGTWLHVFKNYGVQEVLGLDGSWYNKELLFKHITEQEFRCVDLETHVHLDKKYDLVVSLEVAEHISEKNADTFVQSLVLAGKIILFSAAFPGQGGFNHINEQWPSYWAKKFEQFDYHFHDVIRGKIWNNRDVDMWYKQNIFFVVHDSVGFNHPDDLLSVHNPVIHPDFFNKLAMIRDGERGVSLYFRLFLKSLYFKLTHK